MTSPAPPICGYCTRFFPKRDGLTCEAFPDGIPDAIIKNEIDHRQPVAGDHGLRFSPDGQDGAAWAEDVFGPLPDTSDV